MKTPELLYVAIGGITGEALGKTVSTVLVDDDNLFLGPSRADVQRHSAARARYWGGAPAADLDRELASGSGPPLCVALPPSPGGFLALCRVCSAAIETGREVYVMDLGAGVPVSLPAGLDPAPTDVDIQARLASATSSPMRWSTLQVALGATVWRLWCRRSPAAFSRFCATAPHPQLANLGRCHAGVFPRLTAQVLALSRLDELILRELSEDWMTPVKIVVNSTNTDSPLTSWLSLVGDVYLASRLLEWSRHSGIVDRRKEAPAGGSKMLSWSFRWRSGGKAILDTLPGVGAAPSVKVGGSVAYDPVRPWVARLDGASVPYVAARAVE